jgi:hypothetical protein
MVNANVLTATGHAMETDAPRAIGLVKWTDRVHRSVAMGNDLPFAGMEIVLLSVVKADHKWGNCASCWS